jgi:ubiquinone/menaquinone biosynthesis C-methylase UbiE
MKPKIDNNEVKKNELEFDEFSESYRNIHLDSTNASEDELDDFAEYKIIEVARIINNSNLPTSLNVLDFGSGVGNSIPYFKKYMPDSRLTCLDVSPKSLEVAEKRFKESAEYVLFDGELIPFPDNHFDLVFSACVFHHIPSAEHGKALSEIYRVLRPGGRLVVFEHNPYNPITVRIVNQCIFDRDAVLINAGQLVSKFNKAGFDKAFKKYCMFFPYSLRLLRTIERWLTWLPLGAQYYVLAKK